MYRLVFHSKYGQFSSGTPVASINKTNRHDITEILLKVALNTITLTQNKYKPVHLNYS
jgi:hypothetical protein